MQRAIDLRSGVAVNVITMIGIGPLVTIPLVVAALGGPLALIGWIGGALVALCDGLVWAELSSRFPGSGGTYVYLRETFGPDRLGRGLAFLFNWQFLLYAPCLLASGYIGFSDYAAYLFPGLGASAAARDATAVGIGVVTILLLYRRTAKVAALGVGLACVAALTVALVALAGLTHANFAQAFHLSAPLRASSGLLAGFGTALYVTLYDYVGYADVALLGDEVQRPRRTIPLSIVLSIAIVAVLYVCLQVGVLGVIPWQTLLDAHGAPTLQSQYVGSLVVARTWGPGAATVVTVLVLVTAFASLYGNLLGFSRISFAAARDGSFLAAFARLHPRKEIPYVALLVVGGLSLIAAFFTLDQVIAILTAGIVLVQGIAQILALWLLRTRGERAPFRMPLYPLPAIFALLGWSLAFVYTGAFAIGLAMAWLATGAIVFLLAARARRWWPFAAALLLAVGLRPHAALSAPLAPPDGGWSAWHASRLADDRGYPMFTVGGRPFFVYGAAFFYERIPRDRWLPSLLAYKAMGINTIDLYVIWNWHQPRNAPPDFTGRTNPRRDLLGLLALTHRLGFKIVLRPGPVIRNEWRNGGYPAWLLRRPAYDMPLHDVLSGRYPATATLQNAHADAAAAQWLHNATHRRYAARWLHDVLHAVAPYASDVIAIALDDDQGAYLDNDTWPAPHWHAYVDWLRSAVTSVTGPRVPLFVNTFEMKVPAASPAWAWGNWYQSDAYAIGAHDLAELDFATGLLATQTDAPLMQAEFQAGWLQGADEAQPRPADPTNTALALNELLRDGVHGIVNFPVQDTIDPDGWEAPWANWSYAWDAALTANLHASPRYAPTAAFGRLIAAYGTKLARTHPAVDAGIVWPPSMFDPHAVTNADFNAFFDATVAMQRQCAARGLTCTLVDLRYATRASLARVPRLLLPIVPSQRLGASMLAPVRARLLRLRAEHRIAAGLGAIASRARLTGGTDATLLVADDNTYAFVDAIDPSMQPRRIGPLHLTLGHRRDSIPAFTLAARSARLIPIGVKAAASLPGSMPLIASPPPFADPGALVIGNANVRIALAPHAGARVAEFGVPGGGNVATSIGLLRDAVFPSPPPSDRDYIAAYTHPMPAGTFNRAYTCAVGMTAPGRRIACRYDAPDLPAGGARFERTLVLAPGARQVVVTEHFVPHDEATRAQLESISGFAFGRGDTLLRAAYGLGILHRSRLTVLRWSASDGVRLEIRATRGAQLVSLIFAKRTVRFSLGVYRVGAAPEARRLLQANPWQLSGGSGGMADAAASKAAEATHVGSTPTFPKTHETHGGRPR